MTQIILSGLLLGGIYSIVSYGLTLVFGVIRIINFAHGSLLMVGMFFAYYLTKTLNINVYLTLLIVVPCMFLFGYVIQKYLISHVLNEPIMQLFLTFGLLLLLENVALAITRGDYFSLNLNMSTVKIGDAVMDWARMIIFLASILIAVILMVFLHFTNIGIKIRAVSQNRYAAKLIGIKLERIYPLTFGLGCAVLGIASVLLVPVYTIFPHVGFSFVIVAFAVVVLGGLGSIPGVLVGGMIIGLLESLTGYLLSPDLKQLTWYIIFIAVLLFKPAGIFGVVGSEEVGLK